MNPVNEFTCRECGEPCAVDEHGVSTHVSGETGGIDYDADADHVAIPEEPEEEDDSGAD